MSQFNNINLSDIPVSVLFEDTGGRWGIDKYKAKKYFPEFVGAVAGGAAFFTPIPGALLAGYLAGRQFGQIIANKLFDDNYEIGFSNIHGKGIFATVPIKKGTDLGIAFEKVKNTGTPDKDYYRTDLGTFVNHDNKANLTIVVKGKNVHFVATKNIKSGEELTVNYEKFTWEGERP